MSTAIECVHDVNFAIPYSTTTFASSPFEPVHDLQHTHTEGSKLFVVYFIFLLGLVKSTKKRRKKKRREWEWEEEEELRQNVEQAASFHAIGQ